MQHAASETKYRWKGIVVPRNNNKKIKHEKYSVQSKTLRMEEGKIGNKPRVVCVAMIIIIIIITLQY